MKKFALFLIVAAVFVFSGSAQAVLEVRGLGTIMSGGEGSGGQYLLIYDTELEITWLDFTKLPHIWDVQMAWAGALSVEYNGQAYDDWRLPQTMPVNGIAYDYDLAYDGSTDFGSNISAPGSAYPGSKGSEMAHLYYFALENLNPSYPDGTPGQPGWGLQNTGPFENLLNRDYWSSTEYAPISDNVWDFDFNFGWQGYDGKDGPHYAMAVRDGDVAPIPSYTITDLGTLGGETSVASAINNLGDVVGYSLTIGEYYSSRRAFLYTGDVMIDLGTLGGQTSWAHGINNLGSVVGEAKTGIDPDDYQAFLYSEGPIDYLHTFIGHSTATDINESGQVVGWEVNPFGRAFLYDDGSITDLGTLGGETSLAIAINNLGQIVGESTISSYGYGHAFLYDGETMIDLGTLGGEATSPGGTSSYANDINELGEIVGMATNSDGLLHAFIYRDGIMNDLGTLGGDKSQAFGINNLGEVVGHAQVAGDDGYRAFLYTNGFMYDLTTLIPGSSSWDYLASALDINDKGQIVGWGRINGESHAFLLTPVNEDIDGDGIPDDEDACPSSDLSDTVEIDGCDSGVENVLLEDGCTISDLILECADNAKNHGKFVSSVSHTTNSLKKSGTISGREKGMIQKCAGKADNP